MTSRQSRLARETLIGLLTFPLLGTGACVDILHTAIIQGFFNAATPQLLNYVESGLSAESGADESNGP